MFDFSSGGASSFSSIFFSELMMRRVAMAGARADGPWQGRRECERPRHEEVDGYVPDESTGGGGLLWCALGTLGCTVRRLPAGGHFVFRHLALRSALHMHI